MGMSVAFNLTKFINPSQICVLEPDPSYVRSASALSWASIRQQFSLPENIKLSQSSIKFIKEIDNHLRRLIVHESGPGQFVMCDFSI
jgi:glycine/D-amino acid oxidase-like deaminating enzyme